MPWLPGKLIFLSKYAIVPDALYTQNRKDDTFPNPEPRSYILADDGFDPLEYTIDKAKPHRLRCMPGWWYSMHSHSAVTGGDQPHLP